MCVSRPAANPLVLLLAAVLIATFPAVLWLNWLCSIEARFSELVTAAQAGKLEPVPDEEMMQVDTDRGRQVAAMRLRRNPGN